MPEVKPECKHCGFLVTSDQRLSQPSLPCLSCQKPWGISKTRLMFRTIPIPGMDFVGTVLPAMLAAPSFIFLGLLVYAIAVTVTIGPIFIVVSLFVSWDAATIISGIVFWLILTSVLSLNVIDGERSRKLCGPIIDWFSNDKEKEERANKPLPGKRPFMELASKLLKLNFATALGVGIFCGVFWVIGS